MDKKYILIGRDEEEVVLVSPDENVVVVDNKTDAKAIVDALVLYIMET